MADWYRNQKLRVAAMALAAGLVLGGIVTLAAGLGGGANRDLGGSATSMVAALASDRAEAAPAPAKAKAKPKPKPAAKPAKRKPAKHKRAKHRAAKHRDAKHSAPAPAAPAAPTATPDGDKAERKTSRPKPVAAPRRRVASPRVVQKRKATIVPRKRSTKPPTTKPAPAPASAPPAPAPAAPAPAPQSAPAPTPPPATQGGTHGHGHGNGHGGDDDDSDGDH